MSTLPDSSIPAALEERYLRTVVFIDDGTSKGTGCFVGPGLVLTCAHVVAEALRENRKVTLRWAGHERIAQTAEAIVRDCQPAPPPTPTPLPEPYSYPDLALLETEAKDHEVAVLTPYLPELEESVYVYGITQAQPKGDSRIFKYEGPSDAFENRALRLKGSEGAAGNSGAPVLCHRLGAVCALVKATLQEGTLLGARAVPVAMALSCFPSVVDAQRVLLANGNPWSPNMSKFELYLHGRLRGISGAVLSNAANVLNLMLPADDEAAELTLMRALLATDLNRLVSVVGYVATQSPDAAKDILEWFSPFTWVGPETAVRINLSAQQPAGRRGVAVVARSTRVGQVYARRSATRMRPEIGEVARLTDEREVDELLARCRSVLQDMLFMPEGSDEELNSEAQTLECFVVVASPPPDDRGLESLREAFPYIPFIFVTEKGAAASEDDLGARKDLEYVVPDLRLSEDAALKACAEAQREINRYSPTRSPVK
jgi:hypothetical protein